MLPEEHPNTDGRQSIEPGEQPAESPAMASPALPVDMVEPRSDDPPPALAPAPPLTRYVPQREEMSSRGRWALGLGFAVFGGLSWFIFSWSIVYGQPQVVVLAAVLLGFLPALTCLAGGWLMHSWWGLIAVPAVYVVVSALMWIPLVGGGPAGMTFLTIDFALYVVLPAVVMAAIGTPIGIYRTRRDLRATRHLAV